MLDPKDFLGLGAVGRAVRSLVAGDCGDNAPPAIFPELVGFGGWGIPERPGFVDGPFAWEVDTSTTLATSLVLNGQGTGSNWNADYNLNAFMQQDGDFWLVMDAFRIFALPGATLNTDNAALGNIRMNSYIAHTPSGGQQRRLYARGASSSAANPTVVTQAAAADGRSYEGLAVEAWSELIMPRGVNLKNDQLSLNVPTTGATYNGNVVFELRGIAIDTTELKGRGGRKGYLMRRAIFELLVKRYGYTVAATLLESMRQRGVTADDTSGS